MLDIFKEPVYGKMVWSFRRITGALAVVVAVVCVFAGLNPAYMQGLLAYAGSCGIAIGLSEIGKK
jgi:hypothetical protein